MVILQHQPRVFLQYKSIFEPQFHWCNIIKFAWTIICNLFIAISDPALKKLEIEI